MKKCAICKKGLDIGVVVHQACLDGLNYTEEITRKKMINKYSNIPKEIDGIVFDSTAEANRYCELKLLLKAGEISQLELQPKFILQEKFTHKGIKYRAITYKADFRYIENGETIVEDVKGFSNKVYLLKKKLLLNRYPNIDFREVK